MAVVRPSSREIDHAILEAAAEIFAVTGFAGTSVQKVADAVGYSKTGLLHRFPSKQALYDGVLAAAREVGDALLAEAAALPAGPDRVGRVLGALTARALDHPGMVRFLLEAVRPGADGGGRAELEDLAARLLTALGVDLDDPRQRLRGLLALQLVVNAVLTCSDDPQPLDRRDLEPLVARLALGVLGDPPPA